MSIPRVSPEAFANETFDYIIVGGGTAGLAVAARLSEKSQLKIGVLEAGPAALDDPLMYVPGRYGQALGTRFDWNFETTQQTALNSRRLPWGRGKVLGGTSAMNCLLWTRPSRNDLDALEKLGNKGWGWDEILWVIFQSGCINSMLSSLPTAR